MFCGASREALSNWEKASSSRGWSCCFTPSWKAELASLSSFFETRQLTPPGIPLPHEIGGAAEGSSPANAGKVSVAARSPAAIMNVFQTIFRNSNLVFEYAGQTDRTSYFRVQGALFGLPIQERKISPGLQAFARGKYLAATSLRQHQALDFAGLAGVLVAINDYRAQPGIAGGGLEPYWHPVKKFTHHQFLLYSNHAIVGPGHAHVGHIRSSVGQNAFICRRHMCVRTDHRSHTSVQVPTHRNLFRGRLGVDV